MAKQMQVRLPEIGDFSGIEVIEVLVAAGDRVTAEQSLLTLESDKASMEIPSPEAGLVKQVHVELGDKLSEGDLILDLEPEDEAVGPAPNPVEKELEPAQTATVDKQTEPGQRLPGEKPPQPPPMPARPADLATLAKGRKPHASPAVRRFSRELGADLSLVRGSGPKGRITKDDVQSFIKQALGRGALPPSAPAGAVALPAIPEVDFSKFGDIETKPLGRIKKIGGAHLHRSWLNVPRVTQFDQADITELEAFRKAQKAAAGHQGIKLTLFPFLLKACVAALEAMPEFNSSLGPDGEHLIFKRYFHIGVAVDTPNGLIVPVLRDANQKGVFELARELRELSAKARDGKLLPADLQGGCFSISSLGGIGGSHFTPIVNAPEVAILGVGRAALKPVWDGNTFQPRLTLPLALSYDHRVIDGAQGVRFTTYLSGLLSDIRRLLL